MATSDRYDRLIAELNEERVAALLRISRRLESLINQLRATDDPTEHRRLRAEATRYRWYLEVQREALGIRSHANLDEFYAIPDPL
jgi:hypothetical protein